ncbi:Fic family protein [Candidatus Tokpelaia sp.]|uniref:Fic family protein n=1 Tax=Candidatus Tokpelaia sp. TaxID=2233777 RepID=UPI001FED3023|nr:Fic family protein [Candidatus Tokpelaia sp.]
MFRILKGHGGGYRQTPGTVLRNDRTGENVYIPPQDRQKIEQAMARLLHFVNDDSLSAVDLLIKMALIPHQFESIHPFSGGNGRIGPILNILYLTRTGLLDSPILYLSRAINASKDEYYHLLQAVRDKGEWEE